MSAVDFVHLRMHSEFSLSDSLVRIKPLMKALQAERMPAIALTDQSNMFGMIKFYKAAQAAGIKPLCGCDILLAPPAGSDLPVSRMTLLAMNAQGYLHLTELISMAFQFGQNLGKAIIQREWLRDRQAGLIALSGANYGDIGRMLLVHGVEEAKPILQEWLDIFGDRFYLELQRTGRTDDEACVALTVILAQAMHVPVVATNDVMFISADEFEAHETRVAINQSMTLDDPRRPKEYSAQQYLRSNEEMLALFADIPSALTNSVEIAKRCNLDIELGRCCLPNFPVPDDMTIDDFFRKLSYEGLEKRLASILDSNDPNYAEKKQGFVERLEFELDIIIQMGFPGYFLIVMDFIGWAKRNKIPVGPGRGSGAGSLVAYVLDITDLDPLRYDLLFERFLNPERVSMPDFDIDFCMDNRDRVIEYVAQTYGKDAVSQIITFGTMAAKAVVRDVARAQGKPFGLADKLSKLIPFEVGMTLSKAVEQEEALRSFIDEDEEVQEIMDMAFQLEGLTRNVGKHAGGVVIAPTKLTDFSPLYCDEDGGGLVTQYDKGDVEDAGLVKFDFLGLRTLTIVDWAVEMINSRRQSQGQEAIVIEAIDLEDPEVYGLLQRAETTGVFQLESRGMKDLIKRLLPSTFEDIIALVALFRPGPLQSGMVDDFINRKHGRAQLAWPHEDYQLDSLQPVLEPTYGIILYQEQVMQIAQVMAGYTLGGADLLRRAMGKKKPEEMEKQRKIFLKGTGERGIDAKLAGSIFDLMEKFAGYGFNKSHSAAYALVSYQTLFLKTYYPAEFMAAVLSSDMDNTDKVVPLIEECRRMGLVVRPPDVNAGSFKFSVKDGEVIYGLGAIKGLGEGPIGQLVDARNQDGAFTDLFDFCRRVGAGKVNRRALEALIRAGAFDSLNESRWVVMSSLEDAIGQADQEARNEAVGMDDMFGLGGDAESQLGSDPYQHHRSAVRWSERDVLRGEKETLGLYLTGHPIDWYADDLKGLGAKALENLERTKDTVRVAGLVVGLRVIRNKRGDSFGIVTLDDRTARMDVTVFADLFTDCREKLTDDSLVVIEGDVSFDEFTNGLKMRANTVDTLENARKQSASGLKIHLEMKPPEFTETLLSKIQPHLGGECPVVIAYNANDASGEVVLGEQYQVHPNDSLLLELQELLGQDRV
ncbi:MAG TPA: DNA polymerase III subunit alpha, partial [Oceanospirillaceae bacterium]|nr:DNA polymerase III subunit alpha [Oceanospirillaceae bacterium]